MFISEYFFEFTQVDVSVIVETKSLAEHFVTPRVMSKPTMHSSLDRLIESGLIYKVDKGKYALKDPS